MRSSFALCAALTAGLLATGCAAPALQTPQVPPALRPATGQTLFLETLATGVQIYECAPKADASATFEWAFRAPEATLADRAGKPIGKHYAGPTWEAPDGSAAVGEVKGRDPGPDASAIPWLLLTAKTTRGNGVFSGTQSVQRLQTVGGIAPSSPCSATNAKEIARVPYTATYYFYGAASY